MPKFSTKLQVRFTEKTEFGEFSDALYYDSEKPPDEETISKDAQERIDAWVVMQQEAAKYVKPEPTEEELAAQYKQLIAEKEEMLERTGSAENLLEVALLDKWTERGVVFKDPIDIVFDNVSKGLVDVKDLSDEVIETPIDEKPVDENIVEEEIPVVKG